MKAVLAAHGVTDRRVFVADSFEGLPPPDPAKYPTDQGDRLHQIEGLLDRVQAVLRDFECCGLLDDGGDFVKGVFAGILPGLAVDKLAVLRLDGDLYSSAMDARAAPYDRPEPGGFCSVDERIAIDRVAWYWRKGSGSRPDPKRDRRRALVAKALEAQAAMAAKANQPSGRTKGGSALRGGKAKTNPMRNGSGFTPKPSEIRCRSCRARLSPRH